MRLIREFNLIALGLFFLVAAISVAIPIYAQGQLEQIEGETAFDFGEISASSLQSAEKFLPPGQPFFYILPAIFFVIVFILILILWLKAKNISKWHPFFLGRLPPSFKLLITLCFSVYGLVHIGALINVYIQTRVVYPSVAEYFFYMPIQKLTGITHAHLFGHATMYVLTAIAFMFTRASERIKIPVIAAAFLGAPFDIYSWWLIKYLGAKYEILSAVSGAAISSAFLTMYIFVMLELWFRKEPCKATEEVQ